MENEEKEIRRRKKEAVKWEVRQLLRKGNEQENVILWRFQTVPARPSAKSKLEQVKALGNGEG
jgi:hypothetical protein